MKVECVKKKITEVIKKVERAVGKNPNLPALSCLLLKAGNGAFSVQGTNLELGIVGTLSVRILREGVVAVPAVVISSFLSQLPDEGNVTFEVSSGNLTVTTKHTSTTIKCLPSDDFPTIPTGAKEVEVSLPTKEFLRGLQSVWYSSATSAMKPELSSVYLHTENGQLVFAATDSFRLAEKRISLKKLPDLPPLLIPYKNIPDLIRVFEDYGETLLLQANKSQISLTSDAPHSMYVVSRVIEGNFPDYQQIIPKEHTSEVVLLKQDFMNALKIASIFSDTFHQVTLGVEPNKKKLSLVSENSHVGKNSYAFDAVVKGDNITANFNYRYLLDCFQSIAADSITLHFNGPQKPLVIRGVNDRSFTYLVMSMNK